VRLDCRGVRHILLLKLLVHGGINFFVASVLSVEGEDGVGNVVEDGSASHRGGDGRTWRAPHGVHSRTHIGYSRAHGLERGANKTGSLSRHRGKATGSTLNLRHAYNVTGEGDSRRVGGLAVERNGALDNCGGR